MIDRVVSGGQTGVDQASWRVAKSFGIPTGGWMPRGYITEQGPRPEFAAAFGAEEHESPDYPPRTRANVEEADFTLILGGGRGSHLTARVAGELGRPFYAVHHESFSESGCSALASRIYSSKVHVLNVAGSRGSNMPKGEIRRVERFLWLVFNELVLLGHHVVPDLSDVHEDECGEVGARASGQCVCPYCDRLYCDHPLDLTRRAYGDVAYLHVLCSGRVVKL